MRDDDTVSNPSGSTPVHQLMQLRLTRRDALKGMAVAGVYGLVGCASSSDGGQKPMVRYSHIYLGGPSSFAFSEGGHCG